jgi:hypothetical protein
MTLQKKDEKRDKGEAECAERFQVNANFKCLSLHINQSNASGDLNFLHFHLQAGNSMFCNIIEIN